MDGREEIAAVIKGNLKTRRYDGIVDHFAATAGLEPDPSDSLPDSTNMTRGLAMGGHQSASMITDTWLTPPHIIEALGDFDLDPCAAPDPKPWPTAKVHYTLPTDGLSKPWLGRVWLNPPYSREAVKWLKRLAVHGTGTALVFARTETSWFVETVWNAATAVLFLHGRLYFHRADGERAAANAGAPSCLVAYGPSDADILGSSGLTGTFVRLHVARHYQKGQQT